MPRRIALPLLSFLLLPALLALQCGGDGGPPEKKAADAPGRTAARQPAPPAEERDDQPPVIDPNKMEMLEKGNPAERLAAKYELLLERIMLERREGQFTIERSIDRGLRPIAGEHHVLLAEGLIDTTLMIEYVRLAEIVLQRHILSQKDRTGVQAMAQIARIRSLIPEHAGDATPSAETPGESGTPPLGE